MILLAILISSQLRLYFHEHSQESQEFSGMDIYLKGREGRPIDVQSDDQSDSISTHESTFQQPHSGIKLRSFASLRFVLLYSEFSAEEFSGSGRNQLFVISCLRFLTDVLAPSSTSKPIAKAAQRWHGSVNVDVLIGIRGVQEGQGHGSQRTLPIKPEHSISRGEDGGTKCLFAF